MSDKQKTIILYGAGIRCEQLLQIWSCTNSRLFRSIQYLTDIRPETWGSLFFSKPVIAPHELSRYEYDKILITTEQYIEEIYELLLKKYNVPSSKIVSLFSSGQEMDHLQLTTNTKWMSHYDFYVENPSHFQESAIKNWCINEPETVVTIDKGMILPLKRLMGHQYQGGVCDDKGHFIEGHIRNKDMSALYGNITSAYLIPHPVNQIEETVVYCGVIWPHYGHMITESFSRLWWLLENPENTYRLAFLSLGNVTAFFEFLQILAISEERVLIINQPTQFSAVIVPNQTTILLNGGYTKKAMNVYDTIRNNVIPQHYEKIYLTRSRLDDRIVNEEFFESQFASMGYKIIAPEQLTVREQVSILAGAKHIACVSGTLPHQILFCREGVALTILRRSLYDLDVQFWINQARNSYCTIIDVFMNFLPSTYLGPCFLLTPTSFWKKYLYEHNITPTEAKKVFPQDFSSEIIEYMKRWAQKSEKNYLCTPLPFLSLNTLLTDLTILMQRELSGNSVNDMDKNRIQTKYGTVLIDDMDDHIC